MLKSYGNGQSILKNHFTHVRFGAHYKWVTVVCLDIATFITIIVSLLGHTNVWFGIKIIHRILQGHSLIQDTSINFESRVCNEGNSDAMDSKETESDHCLRGSRQISFWARPDSCDFRGEVYEIQLTFNEERLGSLDLIEKKLW